MSSDLDKTKNTFFLEGAQIKWSDYSLIFNFFIACVFFLVIFFGYLQSEILTFLYQKQFEYQSREFCQKKSENLKYTKIISLEKSKKKAVSLCIFQNREENLKVIFTHSSEIWSISHFEKLNQKNAFYWPIYL